MTEQRKRAPFYRCAIQQGAAGIDVVLTNQDEGRLFDLVHVQGRPFAIWTARPNGGSEMLYVDPAQPAFKYTSRPAQPIPVDQNGHPLMPGQIQPGAPPPATVKPDEGERYASIVFPARLEIPPWQGPHTTPDLWKLLDSVNKNLRKAMLEHGGFDDVRLQDEPPDRVDGPRPLRDVPPNGAGHAVAVDEGTASFPSSTSTTGGGGET